VELSYKLTFFITTSKMLVDYDPVKAFQNIPLSI